MKIDVLPTNEAARLGFTHRIEITYADLTTANATHTQSLFTIKAGSVVLRSGHKLVTPFDFSDSGITSLTGSIGDSDVDKIFDETELALDGTEIDVSVNLNSLATMPAAFNADTAITATFVAANGGTPLCSEATSGEVHFFLFISDLNVASARIT